MGLEKREWSPLSPDFPIYQSLSRNPVTTAIRGTIRMRSDELPSHFEAPTARSTDPHTSKLHLHAPFEHPSILQSLHLHTSRPHHQHSKKPLRMYTPERLSPFPPLIGGKGRFHQRLASNGKTSTEQAEWGWRNEVVAFVSGFPHLPIPFKKSGDNSDRRHHPHAG
ncbi:hypothetical protein PaelaDRAFT_0688 [Paenibacillus lactis 154]|uniref:Uncharacterized protein n=1 Tax=Paenibacillus lactis 154 TaxID=743719 RepID=G4H9M7_9BACL|nr:hypothetical protein PaelaDRAFT_0688 [Paenibacillus lactis 154]